MTDWSTIATAISDAGGGRVDPGTPRMVGGGCINRAYRLDSGSYAYFVKLNRPDRLAMFEAEAAALKAMADTDTIRVPHPLCTGTAGGESYIVMEYIAFGGAGAAGAGEAGRRLAAMHRVSRADFGWGSNSTWRPVTDTAAGSESDRALTDDGNAQASAKYHMLCKEWGRNNISRR